MFINGQYVSPMAPADAAAAGAAPAPAATPDPSPAPAAGSEPAPAAPASGADPATGGAVPKKPIIGGKFKVYGEEIEREFQDENELREIISAGLGIKRQQGEIGAIVRKQREREEFFRTNLAAKNHKAIAARLAEEYPGLSLEDIAKATIAAQLEEAELTDEQKAARAAKDEADQLRADNEGLREQQRQHLANIYQPQIEKNLVDLMESSSLPKTPGAINAALSRFVREIENYPNPTPKLAYALLDRCVKLTEDEYNEFGRTVPENADMAWVTKRFGPALPALEKIFFSAFEAKMKAGNGESYVGGERQPDKKITQRESEAADRELLPF